MLALLPASSGAYKVLGILHVLAVIIAFGPLFFYSSLRRAGAGEAVAKIHLRLVLPALTLSWVFGMGMVGLSDDVWKMSQTWIVLGLIDWVILMAVSWFLIRPALTDSSAAAQSRMGMAIGITHLLLIVQLYLMIFKPGAPSGF